MPHMVGRSALLLLLRSLLPPHPTHLFIPPHQTNKPTNKQMAPGGGGQGAYYFLLLVSFFWTLQVVGGVLNCTVAGVVGSWWFVPASDHHRVVSGA